MKQEHCHSNDDKILMHRFHSLVSSKDSNTKSQRGVTRTRALTANAMKFQDLVHMQERCHSWWINHSMHKSLRRSLDQLKRDFKEQVQLWGKIWFRGQVSINRKCLRSSSITRRTNLCQTQQFSWWSRGGSSLLDLLMKALALANTILFVMMTLAPSITPIYRPLCPRKTYIWLVK